MTGFPSLSVYAARSHLLRQQSNWSRSLRSPLHMAGCDGRARNEFAEIIFRISGSGPNREQTARTASAASLRFASELMGLKRLLPFYLTLDLIKNILSGPQSARCN